MVRSKKEGETRSYCHPARFVELWQASESAKEVCDRIRADGFSQVSEETVKLRASMYRRKGVSSLKKFPVARGRGGVKIDFTELEKVARKAARAA